MTDKTETPKVQDESPKKDTSAPAASEVQKLDDDQLAKVSGGVRHSEL